MSRARVPFLGAARPTMLPARDRCGSDQHGDREILSKTLTTRVGDRSCVARRDQGTDLCAQNPRKVLPISIPGTESCVGLFVSCVTLVSWFAMGEWATAG